MDWGPSPLITKMPFPQPTAAQALSRVQRHPFSTHRQSLLEKGMAEGTKGPRPRRILVVDDDHLTAKLLEVELTGQGHEVMTAHCADEATKILLKTNPRPDLLVLDVHMPDVSGEELCRFIKGNSLFEGIQVLLCSAKDEEKLKSIVKACGADGYVLKSSIIDKTILDLLS